MDNAHSVSDPSDWLPTSLPTFSALENSLRCHVCKDFFETPVITSCSHTFCSKCIRDCLSQDGRCPACRTSDQASKLRNNWAIEEVVSTFKAARAQALDFASEHSKRREKAEREDERPIKRRRVARSEQEASDGSQRQTRSRAKNQEMAPAAEITVIDDDDDDGDYAEETVPKDGLVSCPSCGDRMKEEAVFPHLDQCDGIPQSRKQNRTPTIPVQRPPVRPPQPQERLPELNYSILNDGALRKKLKDIGIPNTGPKPLLVRRHTEWVNLWNSNCDSTRPKSKRDLLHELDVWERSQGGMARESHGSLNGIMKKDFDAKAYAANNKDDFGRLIAEARRKAKEAKRGPNDDNPAPEQQNGTTKGGQEIGLPAGGQQTESATNGEVQMTGLTPPPTQQPLLSSDAAAPPATLDHAVTSGQSLTVNGEDLPRHFSDPDIKRVPMFTVPMAPVEDVDQEHEHR